MTIAPILLGLTTAFCWGTSDYLSKRQSEKVGHYNTVVYMHLTTLLVLLVLLPILTPSISITVLAGTVLMVAGILNFFAFTYLYRAFHRGVVSVVAPIAYTYPAFTAIFSVMLLGLVLSATRAVALGCIIAGVVLLSTRFSDLRWHHGAKTLPALTAGVGSAVVSSLLFGIVYVGVGFVTPIVGYVLPVVFLRGIGSAAGFLAAPLFHETVRPTRDSFSRTILIMGALEAIGFLSFNYGLSLGVGSLPVVAALSGMGGAVASSYALFFLHERLERNQLVGLGFSLVGVFILLYLEG
jgi:drug/metabolite transporter (DMT)-like permease